MGDQCCNHHSHTFPHSTQVVVSAEVHFVVSLDRAKCGMVETRPLPPATLAGFEGEQQAG